MDLGVIHYSNSYPFYLELQRNPIQGVEVHAHMPGELNDQLSAGRLHASAISSFEYLSHAEKYHLLPQWCINSKGAVKSVLLFSKCPWEQLGGKNLLLSTHSATSVNLMQLLLLKQGVEVRECRRNDGDEDALKWCDAILLIGDPALRFQHLDFPHVLDLAQAWTEQTQTPIVFGVQAIRKEALASCRDQMAEVLAAYQRVSERLKSEGLGQDLTEMQKAFPDLSEDFESYFKCLDFDFNEECQHGLERYAKDLLQYGRLRELPTLSPIKI